MSFDMPEGAFDELSHAEQQYLQDDLRADLSPQAWTLLATTPGSAVADYYFVAWAPYSYNAAAPARAMVVFAVLAVIDVVILTAWFVWCCNVGIYLHRRRIMRQQGRSQRLATHTPEIEVFEASAET